MIEDLIDNIRQKTELEVIPYLQNQIWSRETNNLNQAHQNLRHFINSAVQIEELLKQYTLSMNEAVEKINFRVSQIEAQTSVEKTRSLMNTLNSNLIKSSQTIERVLNRLVAVVTALLIVGIFIGWVVVTKM
ncbi:MAG: hypothetical protein F6K23_02000 [Okeania sp. SIO2C9]|uniref:hypothetical protein n=1 Tax=Okeania sp. SIO2C9 TaxID=2607791 RepID=UPI0013BEE3FE|nr:hypothetical protein [Okeania sp. SIO2C9]NEQ71949.1 hypothetical protein [Okeania sp. SIO2C9]